MAGLQRFITYIYKYENDEKMDNAGFAKIEIRGSICQMEVHIRNINSKKPEATVYLFARNKEIMQGVPVGTITVSKGNGDIRYAFDTKELLSFGTTMENMEGILIPFEENNYLASQWKEGTIAYGRFRILEKKEAEPKEKDFEAKEQATKEIPKQQEAEASTDESVKQENQNGDGKIEQVQDLNSQNEEKQPIQATELPLEDFFDGTGWERVFQKFRLKSDLFFPFEGKEIECVRLQLKDLQEFPKKYWYLGKNSFLLHGFFNYRHIIFGEISENDKKEYIIGVPGVFQNQERIMASMFGFPEFCTSKATEYKTGNFGYWYRII